VSSQIGYHVEYVCGSRYGDCFDCRLIKWHRSTKKNAADAPGLNHLRSQLKGLVKRKRRLDKVQISVVPEHVQKMAVMIQMLSGDSRWAIAWVLKWQLRFYLMTFGTSVQPSHALIMAWVEKHKSDAELLVILADIEHPKRIQADTFLMESLLYEFIQENSRKGISIPSSALITRSLKNWSYRPVSTLVQLQLLDLQQSKSKRTAWCRRFRKRWQILWGMIDKEKPQSSDLLQQKVFNVRKNIQRCTTHPFEMYVMSSWMFD
jgi:hypothetical protein